MMRIFTSFIFVMSLAVYGSAQCWYFDDQGDELCVTDPDQCTVAQYADGSGAPTLIEALTVDPNDASCVWAADDGIVGKLNVTPGVGFGLFTPLSAAPYLDTGYDLDGLAYDANTGRLWASIRVAGNDSIVQINLTTGAIIGTPIETQALDIDELAFAPPDCNIPGMYASVYDGTQWRLATIDPVTGVVTYIGTGFGLTDAESITFTGSCELLVNNGPGVVYCVNLNTGAIITPSKIDLIGSDVEGMSCEAVDGLFVTLAVDLVSFDVDKINPEHVMVSWETASEINSDHFVLERSISGQSGTFVSIAKIQAAGESTAAQSYHFSDALIDQEATNVYYRLRSVDLDGTNQLSPIRMIQVDQRKEIAAYPNPVKDFLTINLGAAESAQLQLTNVLGSVVRSINITNHVSQLEVSDLPEGNYFLQIYSDNGDQYSEKIIIR